mmetsp:Transcript_20473/g.61050  ORF Transcript_20473/g.61050 Transcript_20473/m.61050 type:complete len:81 (-) Transcript_20473:231-473(-)
MRVAHSNPANLLRVLVGAALLLFATAFVAPQHHSVAQHQQQQAAAAFVEETSFFDVGLDEAEVEFDDTITAARKCGFCMG